MPKTGVTLSQSGLLTRGDSIEIVSLSGEVRGVCAVTKVKRYGRWQRFLDSKLICMLRHPIRYFKWRSKEE